MPVTWKINGVTLAALRATQLVLRLVNQAADALSFSRPAATADADRYTVAPTISFTGGSGSGAAATATIADGAVNSLSLTAGGGGYTSPPTVVFSGGTAAARAVLSATSLATVAISAVGTGYTSAPTVSVVGGGGAGAVVTAQLAPRSVASIGVTAGGSGYTSAPAVALTGGGGSGATAVAVLDAGVVTAILLTNGGAGYTSAPSVSFSGGGGSGAAALATLPSRGVGSVTISNGGNDYVNPFGVYFTGGDGSGASGIAQLAATGRIRNVFIPFGGGGYGFTSAPSVAFSGGGGSGAAGTAVLGTGSYVAAIAVTNGGSGYTAPPSVNFSGAGGFTSAVAVLSGGVVVAVVITGASAGYSSAPSISFTGGGGSGAAATAYLHTSTVASVTITNPGSGYATAPTVSFSGGGGTGGTPTAVVGRAVTSVSITSPGFGYTTPPTGVDFSSGVGTGAAGTAVLQGVAIDSLSLTSGGTGYTSAPMVAFSGGGGSGAAATATVPRAVASITVTNPGSGYTSAPTVSFVGGGGSGTTAAAILAPTSIISLTLTDPGAGYTSLPSLVFSGGGGSGAAGNATLSPTSVASLELVSGGGGFRPGDVIVLTRTEGAGDPVTWFRGVVRRAPRRLAPESETVAIEALGPWHWLERTPYLQSWKAPANPDDTASVLISYLRGRAILNQDASGNKIDAKAFLEEVLAYCAAAVAAATGTAPFTYVVDASLAVTLPWDEVTDLSCADAIGRILSILPDTVAWVDYAPTVPVIHLSRRPELDALALPVLPPGGSSDFAAAVRSTIDLAPMPEQQRTKVVLIYVSTNRANEASWETFDIDAWPVGSAPNHPDALVRTIQLAGSVAQSLVLTQKVNVDPIPAALATGSSVITSGADFSTLAAWWKKHAPDLAKSNVTIKSFRGGTRTLDDGSAVNGALGNELMTGAVTDWMESEHDIVVESQLVQIQIDVEITDPADAAKKERQVWPFSVVIRATNATTRTYQFTESSSVTPPEEIPSGLAQAIHAAIAPLHYEGHVHLTEREPTVNALVGRVLNLTGDLAAWATMNALVQAAAISIDDGRTELRVGPPRHLGVGDLIDLFRANRTRRAVTGFQTRTTGKSGGNAGQQGLSYHLPAALVASRQAPQSRIIKTALTMAGVVPTSTEVATALAASWASPDRPFAGDVVVLTVSGVPKLAYRITLTNIGTSDLRSVSFTVASVTYYGYLTQLGAF